MGSALNSQAATTSPTPVVLIVDDDDAVRQALCELLLSVGVEAVGFNSTQDLLQADMLDRPGCMILDVRMPGLNGLDFQANLTASGIPASIIF